MSSTSINEAVAATATSFSGKLIQPGAPDYDEARRVHNGLINKRPALIARCQGVADVLDAVLLARNLGLEVAVRGGAHNVAGRATVDDGLLIDLSLMKGINVDPSRRIVRAQGGVTWGELNRETQLHELAVTGGGGSTTGIAGLTLGGGLCWVMRKYGLGLGKLLSAEHGTPNGEDVRASPGGKTQPFLGGG